MVHSASDKCAFIKDNCEDEEAGLLSYLSLYYCQLPQAKPVAFTIILLWLGLLFSTIGIAASDFFCVNLSTIASILGTSESLAGVTFLALGNGSPDVFSTFAAMSTGSGSLAVGELVGAAGFITAVVAGSMALVRPFKVAKHSFIRDVGFFTVAATFSIYFLHDGKLYHWECAVMVAFYVFYVLFVVVSHWWSGRKKRNREAEIIARGHFFVPGAGTEIEEYRDDDEDEDRCMGSRSSTGRSMEDFAALERGQLTDENDDDEDEDTRNMWLGEINRNMRITKPVSTHRRSTNKPIRPSLMGALEFRAVLSSLQKSANIQPVPLIIRRYTDEEPTTVQGRRSSHFSTTSDPMLLESSVGKVDPRFLSVDAYQGGLSRQSGGRIRAASAADVERARHNAERLLSTQDEFAGDPRRSRGRSKRTKVPVGGDSHLQGHQPASDTSHMLSPSLASSSSDHQSYTASSSQIVSIPEDNRLTEPRHALDGSDSVSTAATSTSSLTATPLPRRSDSNGQYPKIIIPPSGLSSGSTSPFPAFLDNASPISSRGPTFNLPPPSLFPEGNITERPDPRPPKWWPSRFLPLPAELYSTLFPTVYNWRKKTWWEKFLGVIAAPSVFLLTVTLPVVDSGSDEKGKEDNLTRSPNTQAAPDVKKTPKKSNSTGDHEGQALLPPIISVNDADESEQGFGSEESQDWKSRFSGSSAPEQIPAGMHSPSPEPEDDNDTNASPSEDWRWWLVAVQIFCAPLFLVAVVSVNINQETTTLSPVRLVLVSLLSSLCIIAMVMATTKTTKTTSRPPRWRFLLCFVGFVVSIAWISTIANEVVGVIKTIGVVLDMSDAILGLTVFAVGNSLGDLVANITVARLGFPVMALSACFGGPMLNILLGIGISGLYLTVRGAKDRQGRHPDGKMELRPYHIHINSTLLISGVTLLVTLVTLLIAVPARQWRMDRWIGWGLATLWVVSTAVNVVLEIVRV